MDYLETSAAGFGDNAADGFAAVEVPGGLILTGVCPRCHHRMEFPWPTEVYRGILRRGRAAGPASLPMMCTCRSTHRGQPSPDDRDRGPMTIRLRGGRPATPSDRAAARAVQDALRNELVRVRTAALAWRNGLAGLLVGVVGFSIVKGRSDVGQLAPPYDVVVGALLLAAAFSGAGSAVLLLRAAHGRPRTSGIDRIENEGRLGGEHAEALGAVRALQHGITLLLTCGALVLGAIGVTWYGPPRTSLAVTVTSPLGVICGEVVSAHDGQLVLRSAQGTITIDMTTIVGISPNSGCASAVNS